MSNSETSDLMSIGQHCAEPNCGQVDFLPFRCDCCHKIFCLEHRTYAAHNCPKAGVKQTEIIVCPLCSRAIRLSPGEDPNSAFEVHQRAGCDPSNYAKVHKKPTCPVQGCREKLNAVNKIECKHCGLTVCLKHRLQTDHNCIALKRNNKPTTGRALSPFFKQRETGKEGQTQASTSKGLMFQRGPQRGARSSRGEDLRSQTETYHQQGVDQRGSYAGCPYCGRTFHDPVQLVEHVENECTQKKRSTCAIS